MSLPILQLKNYIVFSIDKKNKLMEEISLTIDANQFYIVLGENGAGKSTLLSIIQHEVQKYAIEGIRETEIDFIPLLSQQIEHYFIGQTPWEELVLAYESAHVDKAVTQYTMNEAIQDVVNILDIASFLHKPLFLLSGGQQQLVALASVLLSHSPLILIDEMTTMLDRENRALILDKIREVQIKLGCSIIYVTHDVEEVRPSDKVILLSDRSVYQFTYNEWYESTCHVQDSNIGSENLPPLLQTERQQSIQAPHDNIVVSSLLMDYTTQFVNSVYTFQRGKLTVIEGKNGAGKSSLLKAISGDIKLLKGQITFASACDIKTQDLNKPTNTVSKYISYCPQFLQYYWSKDTVLEECEFVLKCHNLHHYFKDDREKEAYVLSYLSYFGLEQQHLTTNIHGLSVGQQRRLALALCFMVNTCWLLLDEPFAYLDQDAKQKLSRLIEHRVNCGFGVIVISHEEMEISEAQIETINISQPTSLDSAPIEKTSKKHQLSSDKLHPIILIGVLLVSSVVTFLHANVLELFAIFMLVVVLLCLFLSKQLKQLIKMIVFFALYMSVIGVVIALDFNSWTFNDEKLFSFIFYTFKLIVLMMISFPIMYFISPFRLMRALQQITKKLSKQSGEYMYSIVILFKFITLLQRLWSSLSLLYITKYKRNFVKVLVSFLVHYVRESLLIAESIIINYELRKPLNNKVLIYKVAFTKTDYIAAIFTVALCIAISFNH